MRILVVGGTLLIGRVLVDRLRAAGHEVAVLHRNAKAALPEGVAGLIADRNHPDQVRDAIAGRQFDAVFDNVYDWERGTTAEQVVGTARACGDNLQRYVFMSSVAAFGDGLAHDDDDSPVSDAAAPDPYARNKANSERALFGLHQREGFPAVTVRPPFIYGPGNPYYREAFFWDRLRDRRPIIVPGDGGRLMQFAYVDDIVRVCQAILDEPTVVGRGVNVGVLPPVTQLDLVNALAAVAGAQAQTVFVPRELALAAGGHPMGPKMYFGQYYDLPPITMRLDRMTGVLGVDPTPFEQGLRREYEWWQANQGSYPPPDYAFEDEVLRQL